MVVLAKDDDKLDNFVAGLDPTGMDSIQGRPSLNLNGLTNSDLTGVLSGKMLLVRIIKNSKILAYFMLG